MTNQKFRQFVPTSSCPDGEFMYWGYGVLSPDESTDSFVSPIDMHKLSEQWTGQTDINGIKIYAGDILEHTSMKGPNKEPMRHLVELEINRVAGRSQFILPHPLHKFKICGNIHENPELV